ncbi:MAG TPA: hypothetical protein VGD50_03405 [Candidatus Baltobacteraceae bacterium]
MPIYVSVPQPSPETKPATEFIGGRLIQKMSPRGLHARVQASRATAFTNWANEYGNGRVGTEWDFYVTVVGSHVNPLVADIAYLSYDCVASQSESELLPAND